MFCITCKFWLGNDLFLLKVNILKIKVSENEKENPQDTLRLVVCLWQVGFPLLFIFLKQENSKSKI